MQRIGSLLFCLGLWLGPTTSLRAEYASVIAPVPGTASIAPATERDGGEAVSSCLRFLSPIYLDQYYRADLAASEPVRLPFAYAADETTETGMGQPLAPDSSATTVAAALVGTYELAVDPAVGRLLRCRDRVLPCQPARSLFRPPRLS